MSCPFGYSSSSSGGSSQTKSGDCTQSESTTKDGPLGASYYHHYLQLDRILSSNRLRSAQFGGQESHDEHLFITIHQTYELWFKQILFELGSAVRLLDQEFVSDSDLLTCVHRLGRINSILEILVSQVKVLDTMSPMEFLDFRRYLFPASGFQSVQFRLLENLLGVDASKRLHYGNKDYSTVLSPEHIVIVKEAEMGRNLFDVLEKWLLRCPFLHSPDGDWHFFDEYKSAVRKAYESESILRPEHTREAFLTQEMESFEVLFDQDKYNNLRAVGRVRLSLKALKTALMIHLYRDVPAYHLPYSLLSEVKRLDNLLTGWRNAHALMAHRMLGVKMGTGGSSGYAYLKAAATLHRVFEDYFNLSTFMIPASFLPSLPESLRSSMSFPAIRSDLSIPCKL